MTGWRELETVLDAAAARGEAIRLWWRDDDAGRADRALARLLDVAECRRLPLALAVVPAWLEAETQAWIAASGSVTVLQHGFAHVDHAPLGAKPIELGGREPEAILGELGQGLTILSDAFGATFLAVLVPPWNRLDERLGARLAGCGLRGLSTFGSRASCAPPPGLLQVNGHLDPIDWHGSRLFIGEAEALARLCRSLELEEPIGILTHHLAMDEAGWRFLDRLLDLLGTHPGARLCGADELFATGP
jgi:hypothetical protein